MLHHFGSVLGSILVPTWLPKASPKWHQNHTKMFPKWTEYVTKIMYFVRPRFNLVFFLIPGAFSSLSQAPHPRFNCYLQCFRGVHHFPRSLQNYQNWYPKVKQNHSPKHLKSDKKSMKKATLPKRRKNVPKGCQNGARRGPLAQPLAQPVSPLLFSLIFVGFWYSFGDLKVISTKKLNFDCQGPTRPDFSRDVL